VDSASIVVTSPVNVQNAPRATTWGERFVFGLADDTTARLDCHGHPASDAAGPYRISGVNAVMKDAIDFKFLREPLNETQLKELFQVPPRAK